MRETDLYPPVKAFLEAQGYAVKGEVDGCDLVAVRGDEPPVIVELKAGFSLPLVFQGIARQGLTDNVYLAVPPFSGRTTRRRDALALCRRLGLGLLAVQLEPAPFVEALLDPAEYRPRRRPQKLVRLLREFQRRVGDPNQGGSKPAQDRDGVPAGRASLRVAPSPKRSGQSRGGRPGGRGGEGRRHHAHRPLRLVRTARRHAPRGLRPDPEGPRRAGRVCRCRGGTVAGEAWSRGWRPSTSLRYARDERCRSARGQAPTAADTPVSAASTRGLPPRRSAGRFRG